jgi:hypothetical protein
MKYTVLFVFIILIISSCATIYQAESFTGGYTNYQLSENVYMVSFTGNGVLSNQSAWMFFLTRASEIAIENGYKGFYIIESEDLTTTSQYTTEGYSITKSKSNISGIGSTRRLRGTITTTSNTTYIPPQTYNITKPAYMGQILLVNERIEGEQEPYDANIIYQAGLELNERIIKSNQTRNILLWGGIGIFIIVLAGTT